jgi:serine-type D-Ala-D-Ala carboxypeptidase/endopeptidase (penicillin-binding protein 4)
MSNASKTLFAILAVLLFSAPPASAGIDLDRALANPGFNLRRTSIIVVDAQSGELLGAHQPDLALNPASCAKILTSATALRTLGPDYRFSTNFYADRQPGGGTIGTLYVTGRGDPSLVTEELWEAAQGLRAKGLTRATDGIAIDNSFFDSFEFPRKQGNDGRAYTAKTSAVAVNFNSLGVQVGPGARAGGPAAVELSPAIEGYRIINKLVTQPKFAVNIAFQDSDVMVTGRVPKLFEPQIFWRSVPDPVLYAGEVIRWVFAQNGIELLGPVRAAHVPANAVQLANESSRPLAQIVADMNKFSNNFIAEQLLKHLGGVRRGAPASTEKGVAVVRDYLATLGIAPNTYEMENGSGLSEQTRVSARQLATVLVSMYRDRSLREPFLSSLSVLGVDGTMKGWGRNAPELAGVLLAKTGTINGVSSLAGFMPMGNGRMAAFAILANDLPKGAWGAHAAELAVVRAIAEHSQGR